MHKRLVALPGRQAAEHRRGGGREVVSISRVEGRTGDAARVPGVASPRGVLSLDRTAVRMLYLCVGRPVRALHGTRPNMPCDRARNTTGPLRARHVCASAACAPGDVRRLRGKRQGMWQALLLLQQQRPPPQRTDRPAVRPQRQHGPEGACAPYSLPYSAASTPSRGMFTWISSTARPIESPRAIRRLNSSSRMPTNSPWLSFFFSAKSRRSLLEPTRACGANDARR